MTHKEAVNWLINISADIGKAEHSSIWHYEQALDEIRDMLESDPEIIFCKDCKYGSPNGRYGCKCYHYRLYETHEMYEHDFCSRGERK